MCAWITMPQLERAFAKARNELGHNAAAFALDEISEPHLRFKLYKHLTMRVHAGGDEPPRSVPTVRRPGTPRWRVSSHIDTCCFLSLPSPPYGHAPD